MVPLRTGRVFCAVAWAVSEGSHKLVILLEKPCSGVSECTREDQVLRVLQ